MTATLADARRELAKVYTPEGVEIWLRGANRSFGGQRPVDLIERGEGERVLQWIAILVDGAYA